MAFRRRIGQLANTLLVDHLARMRAQEESQLVGQRNQELSRQASEQQLTNKLLTDPKALAEYLKSGRTSIGNIDLRPMMPKRDDAIQAISADIEKPKNLNETLTPQGVINDFNSQPGAQAVAPGPTQVDPTTTGQLRLDMGDKTGRNLLKPNPSAINGLLDQNFAKRTSMENAAAPVEQESIDPNTGVATKQLVNPYKAVGGQARPTERNATQQGQRDATIADYQEPGKVRTAGKEAGARAAAEAPYTQPQYFTDDNGDLVPVKSGPKGIAVVPGMPPNLHKGTGVRLTSTQVESLASINTAETEGVKILDTLHKTGLDQSNDPLDPRWQKFVVGTLKMAPGDWQKADIQQRTAYVQAAVLSNLVKGRPNKYIAEIYNQHIPQGQMTGAQLTHVLANVIQQGSEKRDEYANLTGVPVKQPVGASYKQWLELNPGSNPSGEPAANPVLDSARKILGDR